MVKLQHAFFAAVGFGLVACGHEKPHREPVAPLEARMEFDGIEAPFLVSSTENMDLLGLWISPCRSLDQQTSQAFELQVNDKFSILKAIHFKDAACKQPVYSQRYIGAYRADPDVLTQKLFQVNIKIHDSTFASSVGQTKLCGYSFWRTEVWYDVSDRYCLDNPLGVDLGQTVKGTERKFAYRLMDEGTLIFDGIRYSRKVEY